MHAEVLTIVLCILFSAFFSAAETALTSLSAFRVRRIIETRRMWTRPMRLWETNHAGVLTTILIGNTVANVTASAAATSLSNRYFAHSALPIAVGVMTLLLLITGEIAPKTLARAYAERAAPPLMLAVAGVHVLLFPVTWAITWCIRFMITLMGGRIRQSPTVTAEDIEYIITLSHRQGHLDADRQHLLTQVFEFADTTAKEIMVPRTAMVAIPVDCPYEQVLQICVDSGFSRIPVYEDSIDKVVGIFFAKNLITPPKPEQRQSFLRSRMRPPVFVPESKQISELLKQFQRDRLHMAIVVNEFGGTEGLVTMEDIIEELLGEIRDEFDEEEPLIKPAPEGGFLADARVNIDELERTLRIRFPEERDYESLGGFLMEAAGEVPEAGWSFMFNDYVFTVTKADVNRVDKVRIAPVKATESQPAAAAS